VCKLPNIFLDFLAAPGQIINIQVWKLGLIPHTCVGKTGFQCAPLRISNWNLVYSTNIKMENCPIKGGEKTL
jgi:hypothetical protein